MIIAQQKKKENIAEYLLYMWQVEDLIRAVGCDSDKIEQLLVSRFKESCTPEQLEAVKEWYLQLRDMLLTEGKRESGHLQINENVLIDLTDLHLNLIKNGQDAIYTSCYYSTLPLIVDLRTRFGQDQKGELETCFTALYGVMMLRLQHKPISEETDLAIRQISKFLALLSEKYKN